MYAYKSILPELKKSTCNRLMTLFLSLSAASEVIVMAGHSVPSAKRVIVHSSGATCIPRLPIYCLDLDAKAWHLIWIPHCFYYHIPLVTATGTDFIPL